MYLFRRQQEGIMRDLGRFRSRHGHGEREKVVLPKHRGKASESEDELETHRGFPPTCKVSQPALVGQLATVNIVLLG